MHTFQEVDTCTLFERWNHAHVSKSRHMHTFPKEGTCALCHGWAHAHLSRGGHICTLFQRWTHAHFSKSGHMCTFPKVGTCTLFQRWTHAHFLFITYCAIAFICALKKKPLLFGSKSLILAIHLPPLGLECSLEKKKMVGPHPVA